MFLLGKQELPKGISFHSGLDWICLHRDFVEYAVTGTDPLVTGLKEMYKYIISPVEVGVLHHAFTAHEHLIFRDLRWSFSVLKEEQTCHSPCNLDI